MDVRVEEGIEPLASEWDALADRVGAAPWLRPGWVAAWWRGFGRGRLRLVTVRDRGRLAGIVPMQRRLGVLASTSNWHTPSFGLLGEDAGAREALAGALFRFGARRITLAFVPAGDAGLDACRAAAAAAGRRVLVRPLERSPYVRVDGDWEDYERRRDGKLLRELRRRRRRLAERGALRLDVIAGTERLDELLEEGLRVEAAAWKGRSGTAILSDAATAAFYRQLAAWAAERGWLRLAFLRLDERAIAFDFCLEHGGEHALLKTGYDPACRAFAPGMLLRQDMLARAFASGLRRYDFLGMDESWKLLWADEWLERSVLQAFSPSPAGAADWAAWAAGRPLARRAVASARQLRPALRRLV